MALPLFPLLFLLLLLVLSVVPSTSLSLLPQSLASAIESLSSTGYVSMALTLNLTSPTLHATATAGATLFSPSDAAFADSGLHLAPQSLRTKTLRSLSQGAQIRTLAPDLSLFITTSATEGHVSLNGVGINESALFDDGFLIIYAAKDFFDPSFRISSLPPPVPRPPWLRDPVPALKP